MEEKLWNLVSLVVTETVKKAIGEIEMAGKKFGVTVYIIPSPNPDKKPVYRVDLMERGT